MTDETRTAGEQKPGLRERIGSRAWVRSAALVGGGLVAGGILAGSLAANAADDGSSTTAPSAERSDGDRSGHHGGGHHRGGPGAGEDALTGDTADSVEEAVLEEYPDATIERLETDSDGVYEAHITTADGEELTVELGEDFAITGTE